MQRLLGRALFILLILLTLPAFAAGATYWAITASTTPAALKSNLSPARPANFGNYTTPNGGSLTNVIRTPYSSVDYVVNIPVGYTLTNVKVDGVVKGSTAGTYTVDKGTLASHTIVANYVAASYIITATSVAGGSITSSLTAPAGTSPTITVTPYTGNQLTGVIIDTTTYALADQLPSFVSKTGGATGATYTFLSISAAHAIKGVFSTIPTATAIISTPSQTLATGATGIAIDGSASTSSDPGTAYGWTASCGSVTATGPNAKTATYTAPATTGSCTVTLTVSASGTNPKQANVTFTIASQVLAATNNCLACHDGTNGPAVPGFTSSPHYGVKSCADCHNPGNSLTHPYAPVASMANICRSCHTDAQGNVPNHPIDIGTNTCLSCHNAHTTAATVASIKAAPHYNNITTGMFPASYVSSQAHCSDCHIEGAANKTIRQQWEVSGHADINALPWIDYDFKTRAGCVQCHTTTGFIAFSTAKVTAAWGVAPDKTKEVLTCVGCHSDISTGAVRSVTPVKPFADEATYINRNFDNSNICMDCHSGRNNGASIQVKVGSADFTTQAFIAPHYLSAGGTLQSKSGYHFPGRTYAAYSSNSHRLIGRANTLATGTNGPCVACHMTSSSKHLFLPVSVDKDGALTAITTAVCSNCHGAVLPVAALAADRTAYNNGLEILKAQLAAIGHVYSPDYPYFTAGNWGTGQTGANVMGAAFNYKLLVAEPGAYAHNPAYAKQLIVDSIDAAYHGGTVTGDISDALAALVASEAITQESADSLGAYKAAGNCASCHTNSSGSHTKHLNSSIGCADCHSLTAASNTALISGTDKHLNGVKDVIMAAGGSFGAGTCSTVYCHSNGAGTFVNPSWTTGTSNCFFCHPLNQLSGAHITHLGSLIPTTYGDTADNSSASEYSFGCANCHPTAVSSHMDGHVDVTLVPTADGSLRSKNDPNALIGGVGNTGSGITGISGSSVVCSAAYCHSNGGVGAAFAYKASPNWYGSFSGDKCTMCHDNAPATGAHLKHAVSIHPGKISDADGNLILGHGDPAQGTTISCDLCHSATVVSNANDQNASCVSCHTASPKGTPALNKTKHLNGTVDVAFKDIRIVTKAQIRPASFGSYSAVWTRTGSTYKVDAGSFDTARLSLNQATFAGDKSCANVACHNGGTPKWSDKLTCVSCHSQL
jgi:trimeric autotransporter adhesin